LFAADADICAAKRDGRAPGGAETKDKSM